MELGRSGHTDDPYPCHIWVSMTDVWKLYDAHAREFDRDRGRSLMERSYLSDLVANLRPGARILDLGCGAGEPIARYLIERGFDLTGVDAAPAMIAICKERFPDSAWAEADMRGLVLPLRFNAVVAWDSFFHLTRDEQRDMFPVFRKHIAPGGLLLFTSGPRDGEAIGDLYGNALFHASLAPDEYRELLSASGLRVLRHQADDPACGGHTVWLAQTVA
jgi:cyclopropane fatty-acyl-phospholipid synthase-like methyltransferase